MFFDIWSTTLDLLHHFRSKRIHAVGTIRLNRLRGCPLDANKDLMKNESSAMDYRCDSNSGIMAVKWVGNSVVNLASNFVGVEPIGELERWCGKEKVRKNIPCPPIVQQNNKSMVGVCLADTLLSLYRITCKTKRCYQKMFWHLIDMAKVNAWILYRRHFCQNGKPHKDQKCLLQYSLELSDVLILANKVNPSSSDDVSRNEEVWRHLPRVKSLLKHCLSPMLVLIKSHIGQALLPTKIDADYPV